jgi:transposase
VIKAFNHQGVYFKDIAAELGIHPKEVSWALKRYAAPSRVRKRRSSKLDPYKPKIHQLLSEDV